MTDQEKKKDEKPWQFKPGQSGNPAGRPKGSGNKFNMSHLMEAIQTVEGVKEKKLLVHFVERAYHSDRVLIALMKKLYPDVVYRENPDPFPGLGELLELAGNGNGNGNRVKNYEQFLKN